MKCRSLYTLPSLITFVNTASLPPAKLHKSNQSVQYVLPKPSETRVLASPFFSSCCSSSFCFSSSSGSPESPVAQSFSVLTACLKRMADRPAALGPGKQIQDMMQDNLRMADWESSLGRR